MPLLSCILLSHLFLMSLQLSAIVILFSELVPTFFETELAVFYSPMLTTTSLSYSTLPFSHNVIPLSPFFISPYVLTPQFLSLPTTLVHLFFFFLELFWLNPSMFLFFFSKAASMFYIISGSCTHCYPFRRALNSYSSVEIVS